MKKLCLINVGLLILSLVTLLALSACGPATAPRLKVITTTSLIGTIAEKVGGDKISVTTIIPPASCPGHFDVKPGDVQSLVEGNLFLKHGWEGFAEELVKSANNPNLTVVTIEVEGNWMAPPVQAQAVEKIAAALSEADPEDKDYYQKNAETLKGVVESKGEELKARLAAEKVDQVNVLCAQHQAGFVKWAGFNVVATYGRLEELTPQKIQELVAQAKEAGVTLVVDNLQSGPETGVQMAQEIGVAHVTLSNFPGGFEGTETWEKAIGKNVELLLEAMRK